MSSGVVISDDLLRGKIDTFLKSSEGRKTSKEQGKSVGYTKEQLRMMSEELKKSITDGFIAAQTFDPHFDDTGVKITIRSNKNSYTATINYPAKTLRRFSYLNDRPGHGLSVRKEMKGSTGFAKSFTGEGVYDIIGLFTQGYNTNIVFGYWYEETEFYEGWKEELGIIPSRNKREPNPFVVEAINKFIKKYPDVNIEYPDLWKT